MLPLVHQDNKMTEQSTASELAFLAETCAKKKHFGHPTTTYILREDLSAIAAELKRLDLLEQTIIESPQPYHAICKTAINLGWDNRDPPFIFIQNRITKLETRINHLLREIAQQYKDRYPENSYKIERASELTNWLNYNLENNGFDLPAYSLEQFTLIRDELLRLEKCKDDGNTMLIQQNDMLRASIKNQKKLKKRIAELERLLKLLKKKTVTEAVVAVTDEFEQQDIQIVKLKDRIAKLERENTKFKKQEVKLSNRLTNSFIKLDLWRIRIAKLEELNTALIIQQQMLEEQLKNVN